MLTVRLRNQFLLWRDAVVGARLYINPPGGTFPPPDSSNVHYETTDTNGEAKLDVDSLLPGVHRLWIYPPNATAEPVGSRTAAGLDVTRIFRGLRVQFEASGEKFVMRAWLHPETKANGEVYPDLGRIRKQSLDIRLKPTWMKSPYNYDRGKQKVDMIVVHKTGDAVIGPAINQFLNGGTSAHYIVDRDGSVLKMVADEKAAGHASNENAQNQSHWGKQTRLAWRSIGIENVGTTKEGFTNEQYRSLIRLIQDLMKAHNVPRHRVIGHSDILTDGLGSLSTLRVGCPGRQFDWSLLENAQPPIGLARTGGMRGGNGPLDGFFQLMKQDPNATGGKPLVLKAGDVDPKMVGDKPTPARFGGKEYKGISYTPIKELQTCLAEIGYSVGPANGHFNPRMARAVVHFQTHFEGQDTNATVNEQTAALIQSVRRANPIAD